MTVRFVRTTSLPLFDPGQPATMNALWVQDSAVNPGRDPGRDGFGIDYQAGEVAGFRGEIETLLIERGYAVAYP